MKKFLITLIVSLGLLALGSSVYADNTRVASSKSAIVKHVFGVHGMSCPFCVIGIKKTFKKIKGVRSVDVSLKHKTVTVYTHKGRCFSEKELKQIFNKTGFSYHGTVLKPKDCGKRL